jgi:hypothetical protein
VPRIECATKPGFGIFRAVVDVREHVAHEAFVLEQSEVKRGVMVVLEPQARRDQRFLLLDLRRVDLPLERDDAREMMPGEARDLDVRHPGILAQPPRPGMRGPS